MNKGAQWYAYGVTLPEAFARHLRLSAIAAVGVGTETSPRELLRALRPSAARASAGPDVAPAAASLIGHSAIAPVRVELVIATILRHHWRKGHDGLGFKLIIPSWRLA